jgi:hypothetical protein
LKNGWHRVYTELFWEAGRQVGLFNITDQRVIVAEEVEKFAKQVSEAKKYWRKKLIPKGCPHSKTLVNVRPQIDRPLGRADIHLEFHDGRVR